MKISAVIITFNEEENIARAIASVGWADEVVVVDSESSDRTREIAAGLGARVVVQPWLGFGKQKQFAAEQAQNDYIFSLDADEVVTPELTAEIEQIKAGDRADGYKIPRLSHYMGRPIRHSGWYPDRQLRLYDRRKGKWLDLPVHESVQMERGARVESLRSDILHFNDGGIEHHARMIHERYAPLSARAMLDVGETASVMSIGVRPLATFVKTFVLQLGFLDGAAGLVIAYFAAYNVFLKNLLVYEAQNASTKGND